MMTLALMGPSDSYQAYCGLIGGVRKAYCLYNYYVTHNNSVVTREVSDYVWHSLVDLNVPKYWPRLRYMLLILRRQFHE